MHVDLISPDIQIEIALVKSSLASAPKPKRDTRRAFWMAWLEFRTEITQGTELIICKGAMIDRWQQTDWCAQSPQERKANYCRWARAQAAAPWLLVWAAAGVKHRALTPAHHSRSLFASRGAGRPSLFSLCRHLSHLYRFGRFIFNHLCIVHREFVSSCICMRPRMNYTAGSLYDVCDCRAYDRWRLTDVGCQNWQFAVKWHFGGT